MNHDNTYYLYWSDNSGADTGKWYLDTDVDTATTGAAYFESLDGSLPKSAGSFSVSDEWNIQQSSVIQSITARTAHICSTEILQETI